MSSNSNWHGTTIVLIRKGKDVVVAGDGQVSLGNTVIKSTAKKVRKIDKRNVIAGFAGSTADALTLFESCGASKGLENRQIFKKTRSFNGNCGQRKKFYNFRNWRCS